MKYSVHIDLELPRQRVVELFDDPNNLPYWQEGLQSFEHLSGEPGAPGAQSRLTFHLRNRTMVLIETIVVRNLPDEFTAKFETNNVVSVVQNRFEELSPSRTRWTSDNEFQFSGLMRFLALLLNSAFRHQSLKYMRDFQAFAEQGRDVRNR